MDDTLKSSNSDLWVQGMESDLQSEYNVLIVNELILPFNPVHIHSQFSILTVAGANPIQLCLSELVYSAQQIPILSKKRPGNSNRIFSG